VCQCWDLSAPTVPKFSSRASRSNAGGGRSLAVRPPCAAPSPASSPVSAATNGQFEGSSRLCPAELEGAWLLSLLLSPLSLRCREARRLFAPVGQHTPPHNSKPTGEHSKRELSTAPRSPLCVRTGDKRKKEQEKSSRLEKTSAANGAVKHDLCTYRHRDNHRSTSNAKPQYNPAPVT
jgi:hypothetical protein